MRARNIRLTTTRPAASAAAALLTAAGDNPDRLRSSSSFAALCGVSPIDASSGRQQPPTEPLRRPSSQLGAPRDHHHQPPPLAPTTQAYMARRLAEGRTPKMIMRCLKRHVVREVYQTITTDLGDRRDHGSPPRVAA